MKIGKLLFSIISIAGLSNALAITSCANENDRVYLHSYTQADLLGLDDTYDYWLAAEPMVSVKESNLLQRVGSLQALYSENGFNQAVLVCKEELISKNPKYLNEVLTYLKSNAEYVDNPNNTDAIKTFTNLTSATTQALINCNGKYVNRDKDINSYKEFINSANSLDNGIEIPKYQDEFYKGFPSASEITEEAEYKIMYPAGAPAVGISNLYGNKSLLSNTTNFIQTLPTVIAERVQIEKPDLAILPSNLATHVFNEHFVATNDIPKYVFLCTVTWGNLYFMSSKNFTQLSTTNLTNLLYGKKLNVLQLSNTPGIALKVLFNKLNIKYEC